MNKVLLDENLPVKLKYRLKDVCEIYTVSDKEWNALENGDLLMYETILPLIEKIKEILISKIKAKLKIVD